MPGVILIALMPIAGILNIGYVHHDTYYVLIYPLIHEMYVHWLYHAHAPVMNSVKGIVDFNANVQNIRLVQQCMFTG